MAPGKRAAPFGEETGRDRKKAKLAQARHIAVQSVPLPSTINVEKFVEARAFEINAMENAMKSARSAQLFAVVSTRARRSLTSGQYGETSKPKKRIAKKGISKQLPKTEKYLNRQRDKTWLETHIWHAKRMHMTTLWGYRIAEAPTAKAFRASHRASLHDAILHDESYFATIELTGPLALLRRLLALVTDSAPAAPRFATGARACDALLYAPAAFPRGLVGPATLVWRPAPAQDAGNAPRTLWIRLHPAAFGDAWAALGEAAGRVLQGTQGQQLEIADLRDEIVAFELVGPKGSRVLAGALQLQGGGEEVQKFWSAMPDIPTPGAVPRGMVVGLSVLDPRVTYPPKNARPGDEPDDDYVIWPSAALAHSDIWDEAARQGVRVPRYRKADLDKRRAQNLIPGTPLEPVADDARVPMLLIQRSVGENMHGWLLLAPRGWGTSLLHALTFTGTRVAGLRQRATQHAEAGAPLYPVDFAGTRGAGEWWAVRGAAERAKWLRTPRAKRVGYDGRKVRSAFVPDWDVVLGLQGAGGMRAGESEAQRGERAEEVRRKIWVMRGQGVEKALREGGVEKWVADLRAKRELPSLDEEDGNLVDGALVNVRIELLGRGAPGDMGMIYMMKDEDRALWARALDADAVDSLDVDAPDLSELGKNIPPPEDIIGYISSGSYSLSRGKGFGVGAIAAGKMLEILQRDEPLSHYARMVKVRDRHGIVCRAATIEIIP
ncbi:POP1-domain-containing protein [Auricularia subglabra TFB-10046 SS5]|nr:POP1-domain-containing protein [Auricularia subglabra TFB-10046 SS5]